MLANAFRAPVVTTAFWLASAPVPAVVGTRTVGTAAYDGGIWSYTDRWGDNTGANTDGKHREDYYSLPAETYDAFGMHRTATNGDYVLPNDDARLEINSSRAMPSTLSGSWQPAVSP